MYTKDNLTTCLRAYVVLLLNHRCIKMYIYIYICYVLQCVSLNNFEMGIEENAV